ncbi:MAG: MarR family winged helix-turn-helix transcriptional regulator [Anaerolineae bacterium]
MLMRPLSWELRRMGYRLAPGQFQLLMVLSCRPINLSNLAETLEVSLPAMSNSVSTLVERGWAKRVKDPTDRRRVLVTLTPEGQRVLEDIRCRAEACIARLLGDLDSARRQRLLEGLEVLRSALSEAQSPDGEQPPNTA